MDFINNILSSFSDLLWGYPLIILLVGTHLFLTIRLKVPQRKIFKAIKLSVAKDKESQGDISQFGALTTALAATIGTGNIIGVATAIMLGGPGAVLWCWLTGVLGIATKYGEGFLAIKYRTVSEKGYMVGGPMYALEKGLNAKWAAVLFCLFTVLASFGIGSTVQANAIANMANEVMGVDRLYSGLVVAVLVGLVVAGGIKSISRVCTALVPFMAVFYVLGCIIILGINYNYVFPAIQLIVSAAFKPEAAAGGVAGGSILLAARYGIARGLFSNESGLGSAPIAAASARTKNPVRQALVSSTGTFWDTVVVCAITGVVVVSTVLSAVAEGGFSGDIHSMWAHATQAGGILTQLDGSTLAKFAFEHIPVIGAPVLMFGLFTFAITTTLGWALYAERAIEYLAGWKAKKYYVAIYLVSIVLGATISLGTVWTLADIFNGLMAIPNLFSLILLSGIIAKDTNKFLWHGDIEQDDNDPTIADSISK